jgi:capsular exopolysaccharide synthesis family protein
VKHPFNNKDGNPQGAHSGADGSRHTVNSESRDEITISELREIVARRRLPLLLCMALGIAAAILYSFALPARYESTARLSVDNEPSLSTGVEMLAQAAGVVDPATLETQVSILETDSLGWEVIRTLRLDRQQEALPRRYGILFPVCETGAGQPFDSIGAECRQILLDEFHKRLHIQALPRTEVIEIRYRCSSRYLAAEVVNTLASLYIERNFRAKYEMATKNSSWIAGQLDSVRKDAEDAARKLIQHQESTGAEGIDGGQNLVLARLSNLSQQLVVAETDRMVQEARYRTAESGNPESLVVSTQGSTLQVLHAQEASLENQYAELDSQFGDAYPKVVQVKEQLAQVREAIDTEVGHATEKLKSEYESAVKSEQLLRAQLEEQKQLVYNTTDAWVSMSLLNRDMEASGELYKQVVKRLKTGGIMASSNGPDISVIDPASVPLRPAEPQTLLNIASGIVVGLVLGLVLSALLEGLDGRVATMKDVAQLCPVSGVGVIPCIEEDGKVGRSAGSVWNTLREDAERDGLDGEVAAGIRSIRTSLIHAGAEAPPKVILVTSPHSIEGSTATSAKLAAAFARMNRRVLLVDADLRRRAPDGGPNAAESGGLAEALRGSDYRAQCIARPKFGYLTILPAGASQPEQRDLLDSPRMRAFVAQWREEFDQIIVNLPQVIGASDAVIMATMVDTVLLTVRAGRGRRNDIGSAMEILESVGARLHGAVVTDASKRSFFARMTSWRSQPFAKPKREYSDVLS